MIKHKTYGENDVERVDTSANACFRGKEEKNW